MFCLVSTVLNFPIVGSFHTDLIDLVSSLNAYEFQKWAILLMEFTDYIILDSCATTSNSFSVRNPCDDEFYVVNHKTKSKFLCFQEKLRRRGIKCEHIIQTAVNIELFHPGRRNLYVTPYYVYANCIFISISTDWAYRSLRREMMFGEDDGILCVYVGRISREKRLDILIEALRQLDRVYLAIVGKSVTWF
jgi:glycosyltransferase involved in cell wall biosynthesis